MCIIYKKELYGSMERRNFVGALVAAVVGTAVTSESASANAWGIGTKTDVDHEAGEVHVEVTNYLDTSITPTVRVSGGEADTGLARLPKADPGTVVEGTVKIDELDASKGVTTDLSLW